MLLIRQCRVPRRRPQGADKSIDKPSITTAGTRPGLTGMPAAPKYAFTVKAVPLWLTVLVILLLPLVAPELSKTGMIPFLQGRRSKMWKSPAQTRACPLGGSAARAQAAPSGSDRAGDGASRKDGWSFSGSARRTASCATSFF